MDDRVSADELLPKARASREPVTRRLAAKVDILLEQLRRRVAIEESKAEIVRLRAELAETKAKTRGPGRPMTTAVAAECVRLYVEERLTVAEVGERLDRPWSTVRRALLSAGVRMRSQRWSAERGSGSG